MSHNFLKIGDFQGESIPASARRIGYGVGDTGSNNASSMWWGDGTITLSNYIMILATEYKLLQNQGEDTNPTAVELYYALNAINRLDFRAESYLSDNNIPDDINGLLLRDDVNEIILENFQNDYSVVFDRSADLERVASDFYTYGAETNNKSNVQSLDQLVAITLACETVKLLVGNNSITIPDGTNHDLGQMSVDIVGRIKDRLEEHEWVIYDHRGKVEDENSSVNNNLGHLVPRGFSVQGNQPAIEEAYKYMTTDYAGYTQEQADYEFFGNQYIIGDPIRIVKGKKDDNDDIMAKHQWTAPWIHLKYDPNALTALWWKMGHEYQLPLWQDSDWLMNDLICNTPLNEIRNELLVNEGIGSLAIPAVAIIAPEATVNVLATTITTCQVNNIISSINSIANINTQPILFSFNIENLTKDDNVRITLESAVASNLWPADYVYEISNNNGFHQFPLLQVVLHNNSQPQSGMNHDKYFDILKTAPCEGPWASTWAPEGETWSNVPIPPPGWVAPGGWAGRDRLSHPGEKDHGTLAYPHGVAVGIAPEFRGEYPGLDYMLYHNLYYLVFADQLPDYKKVTSCNCVEQFTYAEELTEDYVVEAKFPSYRAMGIESPSFLSHDLLISSNATLTVGNDLVLCGGYEDDFTELTIGAGCNITSKSGTEDILYTITANQYTRLIIDQNSSFVTNSSAQGVKLILKSGSELIVKDGATLDFIANDGLIVESGAHIYIESGATAIFSDFKEIDNDGIIHIDDGAQLVINASDNPFVNHKNIDAYGDITLDGGTLENHHFMKSFSTINILNGGLLDLKENSDFNYFPTCELTLQGDASRIELEGTIKIKNGGTFEVLHPNGVSGYIHAVSTGRFKGNTSGPKSKINLVGDGSNDLILLGDLNLSIDDRIFKFNATDCKIQAEISCGKTIFWADNVKLENGVFSSFYLVKIDGCTIFQNPILIYYAQVVQMYPLLGVNNSTLSQTQIFMDGGQMSIRNSSFHQMEEDWEYIGEGGGEGVKAYIYSTNLRGLSHVVNCRFYGGSHSGNILATGYYDVNSNVLLDVRKNLFRELDFGILKDQNGSLRLKCNDFEGNDVGIQAGGYVSVRLDKAHKAGYNKFENNTIGIKLLNAKTLDLDEGYNNFALNYPNSIIEGSIIGNVAHPCYSANACAGNYPVSLSASNNFWFGSCGSTTNDADHANYFLRYTDNSCPPNNPWCNIHIQGDVYTDCKYTSIPCGQYDDVVIKLPPSKYKSTSTHVLGGDEVYNKTGDLDDNPILFTSSFDGITLDSALVYSVSQLTYIDSVNGNDEFALSLIHEALTSDLDRSNPEIRWKMDWAQDYMKIGLEEMYGAEMISDTNNVFSFDPITQQYVDVLNLLTDTLVNDSNYRQQFYLEIDKAQFFRMIGNLEMSYQLAGQIGSCDIDSLEQKLVNDWLKDLQVEMFPDSLVNDSLPFIPDTTLFTIPEILVSNEFFFGSIIQSPNMVTYNPCQVSLKDFAFTINTLTGFTVFPNPNQGDFVIKNNGEEREIYIKLLDANGRTVFESQNTISEKNQWKLHIPKPARGMYNLQILAGEVLENHRLIIE